MPVQLILDTSAVIVLAKSGLADLLPPLANRVAIPAEVEHEVRARPGTAPDAAIRLLDEATWIERLPPLSIAAHATLGPGELAVIQWAQQRPGWVAVLDDLAARTLAFRSSLRVTGCVGLVQRAKVEGLIGVARPAIDALRAAGLYMSDPFYVRALADVGE